jgi:hypothetical protein
MRRQASPTEDPMTGRLPTPRELGDERRRYGRRSLRDRAIELVDLARAHPLASAVAALFVGVMVLQLLIPARSALPRDLEVGDCLYVRTSSSLDVGPNARPIGDPATVEGVLMSGGAEQAGCNGSHGHEVLALVEVPAVPPVPSGVSTLPTVRAEADAACLAAFAGYVGHQPSGSQYESFAALPPIVDSPVDAICLVARRDGQWMTHPARGSGE